MTSVTRTPPVKLARRARHRKPNRRAGMWRRIAQAAATVALLAATGATGAALQAITPPPPTAATSSAASAEVASVNWTARTCSAFAAWQRHHTTSRLDAMLTDSEHVTWKYLGQDAAALYADVRGHSRKYLGDDIHNLVDDCHPGSGL